MGPTLSPVTYREALKVSREGFLRNRKDRSELDLTPKLIVFDDEIWKVGLTSDLDLTIQCNMFGDGDFKAVVKNDRINV